MRNSLLSVIFILLASVSFVSCEKEEKEEKIEGKFSFLYNGSEYKSPTLSLFDNPKVSGELYNLNDAFLVTISRRANATPLSLFIEMTIGANEPLELNRKYDFVTDSMSSDRPSKVKITHSTFESGWISFTSIEVSADKSLCKVSGEFELTITDTITQETSVMRNGIFENLTLDYFDDSVVVAK